MDIEILTPSPDSWTDYELLDSGDGEKLERFGPGESGFTVVRPDPRALWKKSAPPEIWNDADASYKRTDPKTGVWDLRKPPPDPWHIRYKTLTFSLKPTEFKHVGVFPEQSVNWDWIGNTVSGRQISVLNLFAYTGGATMAALVAGARVTHVDASKSTITWAKDNTVLSGLHDKPVRWIEDDAMKFVQREAKRGNSYDGIILDPPRFGRGSRGEVWKLETDLPKLLRECRNILSGNPKFVLINAYTSDISSIVLGNMMKDVTAGLPGMITGGELAIADSSTGRLLPHGIFCRYFN